jgi:hypothetical protein
MSVSERPVSDTAGAAAPDAPQGLTVAPAAGRTVTLSWAANPVADAVIGYRVYRTRALWMAPQFVGATIGTSLIDDSLELLPGTSWIYLVAAQNGEGLSPVSAVMVEL